MSQQTQTRRQTDRWTGRETDGHGDSRIPRQIVLIMQQCTFFVEIQKQSKPFQMHMLTAKIRWNLHVNM